MTIVRKGSQKSYHSDQRKENN